MGQKVHPYGFRLGYNKDWHSHWFAKKQFGDYLLEDLKLKSELKGRFAGAGVSHIDVERAANRLKIIIYTSRPGIIIGRKGAEIDKLKGDIASRTGREVLVSIQEIHKPELNAQLQAEKIAAQLEKRIAFRRAMRKAVEETLRFGAQGIKVKVSGRLNGAEIARSEWHLQGRLPLAHAARRHGLRLRRGAHDLRRDRRQVLDLPRRDSRRRRRRWRAARRPTRSTSRAASAATAAAPGATAKAATARAVTAGARGGGDDGDRGAVSCKLLAVSFVNCGQKVDAWRLTNG